MVVRLFFVALFSLILTACSSNPASYLPSGTQPIVNIEAQINDQIEVDAKAERLQVKNRTQSPLSLFYKLFWYDKFGVTQTLSETQPWQSILLNAEQSFELELAQPTPESTNYRIYLRGQR